MTSTTPNDAIPVGTRVLNTDDGEPGSILSAYAWNPATGEWTDYEVVTNDAIEIWPRENFILLDEAEAAARDAD
jgi:hypothetical protein